MDEQGPAAGAEGLQGAPPLPADASAGLTRQVPRGEAAAGVHHSDRNAAAASRKAGRGCVELQFADRTACRVTMFPPAGGRDRCAWVWGSGPARACPGPPCGLLDLVTANVARRIRNSSKRSATCPVPPLPR